MLQCHLELTGRVVIDRFVIIGTHGGANVDRINKLGMFCHVFHYRARHVEMMAVRGVPLCRIFLRSEGVEVLDT